ncbi:hypothetical protein NLG97_g547 [Lecanicillium saksenae]|uniref:Uncharacterized protein n=1 Tax=Lecanicillium saksenae TaxID=468837 RepID=A0ACC1R830_9HYPO|nr:hypothetical protein NLG97_g547 [Lecanicillium saksenae]
MDGAPRHHDADCIARLEAILANSIAAGAPGLSATIATADKCWNLTAGSVDGAAPVEPSHVFGVGSITKVVVAVVVFQLIEEGKLQMSDTVGKLLSPSLYTAIENAASATVARLLSHHAGIDSWEDDLVWIREGRGDKLDPEHLWGKAEPLEYIRRPRKTAPAPGNYGYSNTNYTLLGFMIEEVTGNSAEAEIRRRILDPLRMEDTFFEGFEHTSNRRVASRRYHWATDTFRKDAGVAPPFTEHGQLIDCTGSNLSVEWTAGGIMASASDLVKFAVALRDGKLLQPESMAVLTAWTPVTETDDMGHGIFRKNYGASGTWIGHFGGVLGFTGALWWKEMGDAVIAVVGNVGTMHCGKVPSSAAHVVIDTNMLDIVMELVQ